MAHRKLLHARIIGLPYVEEQIKTLGQDSNLAPTVMKVYDMDEDQVALLVVNSIIASAIARVEGSPIGRVFRFAGGEIREGKRYRDIQVAEMEVEE